jgi:hypothetical protein
MSMSSRGNSFANSNHMRAIASEADWYGNNPLHHVYALNAIDCAAVSQVLTSFPLAASATNQFGRLPLHYALDRLRVDTDGLKLLVSAFPAGAGVRDHRGITPFNVAEEWAHSNEVLSLLAKADPGCCDWTTKQKLKFPYCACVFGVAALCCRRRVFAERDDAGSQSDGASSDADDVCSFDGPGTPHSPHNRAGFSRANSRNSCFSDDVGPHGQVDILSRTSSYRALVRGGTNGSIQESELDYSSSAPSSSNNHNHSHTNILNTPAAMEVLNKAGSGSSCGTGLLIQADSDLRCTGDM